MKRRRWRGGGSWRVLAGALALGGCTVNSLAGSSPPPTTAPTRGVEAHQLVASDGRANDHFGGALWFDTFAKPVTPVYVATPGEAAISANGAVAVVGSPGSRSGARLGAGAVYVFAARNGRWAQVAKLVATDAAAYDALGWSVAISGDGNEVLAGAPYADDGARGDVGAAYFFRATSGNWAQVAKVRAPGSTAYDSFGWSVGMARNGTRAIVGATGRAAGGRRDAGAAYVFRRDTTATWIAARALTAPSPSAGAEFGGATALSADGSTALVTALTHFDARHVLHSGAAFVFGSSDAWKTAHARARFADPNHNADGDTDAYGVNAVLSDSGAVAAVAAPDVKIGTAGGAGATYVYSTTGDWTRPSTNTTLALFPTDPHPFLYFGSSVALSSDGSRLLVGVDGGGVDDQGQAELVELSRAGTGALRAAGRMAIAPPNSSKGRFGTAVAIAAGGTKAVLTAPWLAVRGAARRGSAFVVALPERRTS